MRENTRDPRIQEHVVTVHLAEIDLLVNLGTLIAERLGTPPPADAAPAVTPFDLGLVPWAFHDPQQGCEVVSYLDDREQVRHVPTTRMTEVPKKWRHLWIASS